MAEIEDVNESTFSAVQTSNFLWQVLFARLYSSNSLKTTESADTTIFQAINFQINEY